MTPTWFLLSISVCLVFGSEEGHNNNAASDSAVKPEVSLSGSSTNTRGTGTQQRKYLLDNVVGAHLGYNHLGIPHGVSYYQYGTRYYFYGKHNYQPSDNYMAKCEYILDGEDVLEHADHYNVTAVFFECEEMEYCCDIDCCYRNKLWGFHALAFLLILTAIIVVMLIMKRCRNNDIDNGTANAAMQANPRIVIRSDPIPPCSDNPLDPTPYKSENYRPLTPVQIEQLPYEINSPKSVLKLPQYGFDPNAPQPYQ